MNDWSPEFEKSSAWNLSLDEGKRLAFLLRQRDIVYTKCCMGKLRYLKLYFTTVKNIYFIFRPILEEGVRKTLDRRFEKIEQKIVNGELNWQVLKAIEKLDCDVQYWRQEKGLGFVVRRTGGANMDLKRK